jgi:hypothetical protein
MVAALLPWLGACSGTDIGYPRAGAAEACPNPLAGSFTAGTTAAGPDGTSSGAPRGGAATGGVNASAGGSAMGGAAGTAPETAGEGTAGGVSATMPFAWESAYDAQAQPMPVDGHHNAGAGCMSSSCHGSKVPFVFGGTVYQADGVTGAPNVEVGISDGSLTLSTYSAVNGNVWLPSSAGAIDLASARIAIRNANGERVKPASAPRGSACNGGGCHGATMRLLEP